MDKTTSIKAPVLTGDLFLLALNYLSSLTALSQLSATDDLPKTHVYDGVTYRSEGAICDILPIGSHPNARANAALLAHYGNVHPVGYLLRHIFADNPHNTHVRILETIEEGIARAWGVKVIHLLNPPTDEEKMEIKIAVTHFLLALGCGEITKSDLVVE
jgi:hypothetical protein